MRRIGIFFVGMVFLITGLFTESYKTGEALDFFPEATPMVANKSGDSSSCYITKISKAVGYTDGTYELQLTSADWIGASVFPVTFTYLVKKNDVLDFVQTTSFYYGSEPIKVVVKAVSENSIELEWQGDSYGDINPSEDSL